MQLPDETVTFPTRPIDVPSGAYFIWPINMDLSGVRLVYATAQPVTRVDDGSSPVYVFHAQNGIPVEFSFDGKAVDRGRRQIRPGSRMTPRQTALPLLICMPGSAPQLM